jgi:hypothetical protein
MLILRPTLTASLATLMLAGLACSSGPPAEPAPAAVPDVRLDSVPSGQSLLYVFNASGATLIKNNYEVKADGRRIADLPRSTYSVVAMTPGRHKLEGAGRKLDLTLVEGQRSFLVVAYQPDKSWAFPLAGSPIMFETVSEGRAKVMISSFSRRGGPVA